MGLEQAKEHKGVESNVAARESEIERAEMAKSKESNKRKVEKAIRFENAERRQVNRRAEGTKSLSSTQEEIEGPIDKRSRWLKGRKPKGFTTVDSTINRPTCNFSNCSKLNLRCNLNSGGR